jgi:hypothetical protein
VEGLAKRGGLQCTEILGSLSRQHFHQRSFFLSALLYLSLCLKAFSAPFFTTIHDLHDLLFLSSVCQSSLKVSLYTHLLPTFNSLSPSSRYSYPLYSICVRNLSSSTRHFFTPSLDHLRGIVLRLLPPHYYPLSIILAMDSWRVAVLGDGGVGKTALAVQVSSPDVRTSPGIAHVFLVVYP